MGPIVRSVLGLAAVVGVAVTLSACGSFKPGNAKANQPLKQETVSRLKSMGSSAAAPMMVRIFKETSELEVWKQTASGGYKLFKTYEICAWSGTLGPKVKEGDRQSPEGFYTITPGLMNPNSSYYLAFNTGFPNKFDRAHGRTGSDLMVHGDCSSRGCYSMTDESIAEIYALARETFAGGNASFQLQIFPFRMTPKNMARHASNPNMSFWKDIKEGHDRFEISKAPPSWDVCGKEYAFGVPSGTTLDALGACPAIVAESIPAAVKARMAADEEAMRIEVASAADREAKLAAEAEKAAAAQAEAKARGEAIGNFFGGLFGGDQPVPQTATPTGPAPTDAPVPAPRPDRA